MATTATKTSTRTKALAAVGVLAAVGIVGFAAAMMYMKAASPDLVVTMSESSDPIPYDAMGGTEVSYVIKVTNQGNKKTGQFQFEVTADHGFNSRSNVDVSKYSDITEILEGYKFTVINLSPGESVDTRVSTLNSDHNRVPCDGSTTDVFASVSVDSGKVVSEINESNNTASQTTTFKGTKGCPDLSATISENLDPVCAECDVEYNIIVTNNGLEDTSSFTYTIETSAGDFDNPFMLESNTDCVEQAVTKPSPHNIYVCTSDLPSSTTTTIGDNSAYVYQLSVSNTPVGSVLPACGKTKEYFLKVEVDGADIENETDETNNTATETTTFEGPAC